MFMVAPNFGPSAKVEQRPALVAPERVWRRRAGEDDSQSSSASGVSRGRSAERDGCGSQRERKHYRWSSRTGSKRVAIWYHIRPSEYRSGPFRRASFLCSALAVSDPFVLRDRATHRFQAQTANPSDPPGGGSPRVVSHAGGSPRRAVTRTRRPGSSPWELEA